MEKVFDWSAPIVAAWSSMVQKLLEFLPQFVGAAIILFVGWLVARTVCALRWPHGPI